MKSIFLNRMPLSSAGPLEEIVHAPDQEINHHNFLTAEERQQILVDWNQTDADYPKDKTIHQLFEEQVDKTPDNIALVYEDTTLTYRELNNRANQLAHYLKKHHDIRPDTLIALCLDRSEHMLVAILAVLKSGGAYVPIDPNYPEERIAYILEDTKTKVVITNETYEEKLIKISSSMLSAELEQLSVLAIDCIKTRIQLSAQPELDLKTSTTSINLAYVIYTSGTTGKPKGVMIEHISYTSVVHCMKNLYFSHTQNISTYSITNYVFDIFGLEYGIPLFSGGIIYIGFRELSTLDCQKFDFIQMTPSVCDLILDCLINTSHLKLFVGGDTLSRELLSKLLNKFINIVNVYGPTETTIWSTSGICSELEDQNSLSVNLGKPLSNESTYILSTALTPLPIGAIGELYIGGLGLARGYLNQPDLTIERFIPNPFRTEEEKLDKRYGPNEKNARLYRTGDLARYLPDGNIEYLGRIDEQVKIRGYRIEPGEIENVLNGYKDVRSSIVLAREEDGSKRLVAYIVPDEEKKTSLLTQSSFKSSSGEVISIFGGDNLPIILEHIRNHVSKQLPDYMIPSFFVLIDKLPLTSNGKVDKKSLPSPDVSLSITSSYVAPRNEIERKLCAIWSEVLGIENIGINENFFEIGGHSLLSLSLFAKIKKVFFAKISLVDIFTYPSIAYLGDLIASNRSTQDCLLAIQPSGSDVPLFLVHPAGGFSFEYQGLSNYLKNTPIYGINNPYQGNDKENFNSVEDMAAYYVTIIQTIRPLGPYRLGGYSFGGTVAYEIAVQLKEQGSEVQFVILIDSGNFSNLTFTNIDSEDEVDFKLKKHILSEAEMGILLQMEKSKQLALKYTPSYYDGRVVLLKAYSKDKNYKEIVMEYDNGWNSVLKNALEIYSIEGKHEQLLDAYHLPIVAQKIKNIIETPIPAILINPKLKTIDKHFLHATLLGDEYLIGKLLEAREQVSINSQT